MLHVSMWTVRFSDQWSDDVRESEKKKTLFLGDVQKETLSKLERRQKRKQSSIHVCFQYWSIYEQTSWYSLSLLRNERTTYSCCMHSGCSFFFFFSFSGMSHYLNCLQGILSSSFLLFSQRVSRCALRPSSCVTYSEF